MAVGCRIKKNIVRPDRRLVEAFRGIPVANIDDCMNRLSAVQAELCPMNSSPLLGTAFTVKCPAGDNLMFHKALDLAQPGDVLVIAAGGSMSRALCGEIMATYARSRGIAGFIIDGCVRDRDELAQFTDFPVYAKGVIPNGPYKNGPGEINFPVSVGGRAGQGRQGGQGQRGGPAGGHQDRQGLPPSLRGPDPGADRRRVRGLIPLSSTIYPRRRRTGFMPALRCVFREYI